MGNSENSSIFNIVYLCATSSAMGNATFTTWFVVYLLISPLFLFVLFIGITKWQKRHNSTTVGISHSDVFTFHMMGLEILMFFAVAMCMYGVRTRKDEVAIIGSLMVAIGATAQTYFHCLTCGERYLAVVHPITYLHLKKRGGVTIRNISIVFTWMLSFTHLAVIAVIPDVLTKMITSLLMVAMATLPMTFCSVSALCVLIRPGPGEGGGNRNRIDQSKRSAFVTITAILGVLLVRMVQLFVFNCWILLVSQDPCIVLMTTFWLSLPSSLVLPLLFLHRARKLPTCC